MRAPLLILVPLALNACDVVTGLSGLEYDLTNGPPPPTCGNGVLDDGEQCDDGGESAACNADCTTATCGDGKPNDAAGEPCDDAGESVACNSDCTQASCGDGKLNISASESCDDGGESAACNADCRDAACGDGTLNVSAGEMCDDGGVSDDDGCSALCISEGNCAQPGLLMLSPGPGGSLSGSVSSATSGVSEVNATACDSEPMSGAGPDRTFRVQLASAANIIVRLLPTFDGIVRMTTAPCTTGQEVLEQGGDGCAQRGGVGNIEVLHYGNLAAGDYFISVDGAAADDEGAFQLDVSTLTGSSCNDLRQKSPLAPSGVYVIDADGSGAEPPFTVYCDMTSEGGGWTLIGRFANGDAAVWAASGDWWYDETNPSGATSDKSADADMLSRAFWLVDASELKLARTDSPDDAHLFVTTAGCLRDSNANPRTFREHIASYGDFRTGAWPADTVQGSCSGDVAATAASTAGFAKISCGGGAIGAADSVSFWARWTSFGSVMLLGSSGAAGCGGATHGMALVQAATGFNPDYFQNTDFGDAPAFNAPSPGYAINLFVR